ncbi:hypothetical protein GCM10009868_06260 [Terrabacter aerolatus]|uniref:Uncharacterized protein n=1 Tax=Terrabacter aerolatus TaxID=422442 RepID=A0A512D0Y7_9MICO|nr:hypothetical protein [Terrabacter aerolatus]GEO30133.1 hypothetical protein TAE01_19430 [Terrabacter aerolatus]
MPMPRRPRPATSGRRGAPRAYAVPAVALGLSASLVLALAACGQPAPSPDSVPPTVSVAVQPTITPDTPSDDVPDAGSTTAASGAGLFDAASSLTSANCAASGNSWSFTGTLTNSDSQEHTFTVAVFIVKSSDGSNVAGKEVDVTLAAGAATPVSIKNFHSGPTAGVECLSGVTVKDS